MGCWDLVTPRPLCTTSPVNPGSWKKASGNFRKLLEISENVRKVSRHFWKVSRNFRKVSRDFRKVFRTFRKLSESFCKVFVHSYKAYGHFLTAYRHWHVPLRPCTEVLTADRTRYQRTCGPWTRISKSHCVSGRGS